MDVEEVAVQFFSDFQLSYQTKVVQNVNRMTERPERHADRQKERPDTETDGQKVRQIGRQKDL